MSIVKKSIAAGGVFIFSVAILLYTDIIWTSPGFYRVENPTDLKVPVMDMRSYEKIWQTHRRPYCYSITSTSGGVVYIVGAEHLKEETHPQFDTIRALWNKATPNVALVEGRLGFLITWFQDPIKQFGEGGLVAQLAKSNDADLYTWEPTRNDEIDILMKQFPVEQLAMFYTFRPYFSNMRHGKPNNPEDKLQSYLESRTDYEHIKGIYQSWEQLDSIWQRDFPGIEWRSYSDEIGWPDGYLYDIWNSSNRARDIHLIQVIVELVQQGEVVFVTMGASHAPRIEKALQVILE